MNAAMFDVGDKRSTFGSNPDFMMGTYNSLNLGSPGSDLMNTKALRQTMQ